MPNSFRGAWRPLKYDSIHFIEPYNRNFSINIWLGTVQNNQYFSLHCFCIQKSAKKKDALFSVIFHSNAFTFKVASSSNQMNVFLTPHLSPTDSSPVLTMKRKLWNISMGNQSFHEQWLLETSRNTVFQRDSDHFLQENGFVATNTPPVGCEWHYNITLYHIRLSVLPTAASLKSKPFWAKLWHI